MPNKKQANRAVQGDRVVVELLQNAEWKKAFDVLPVEEDEDDSAGILCCIIYIILSCNTLLIKYATERSTKMTVGSGIPTGHVVGILQRNWSEYVVCLNFFIY